jgi:hypothetical protein
MSARHLANANDPENAAPELEWINGRVRLLGESFGAASRQIEQLLKDGAMIEVEPAEQEKPQ